MQSSALLAILAIILVIDFQRKGARSAKATKIIIISSMAMILFALTGAGLILAGEEDGLAATVTKTGYIPAVFLIIGVLLPRRSP